MSADRPTDTIRDAFDPVRLDDLRGALEIHGWLTGEDSKEALDEIERAWGEIERLTRAAEEHNRRALPPFALTDSPPVDREALGRLVREVWIEWAYEQAAPKPSWLVPWDDMAECDREVDRRIGERVAQSALARPVTDGADWTPERHREARERCERATPGPWVHSPPGVDEPHVSTKIGSDGERVDWLASPRSAPSKRWHDAAFIAHAREDLPAALGEIERLTAELAVSTAENASLMQSSLDEIGRLTTALEQRRAPADASLEARARAARFAFGSGEDLWDGFTDAHRARWAAVVRAVDASRPGLTLEQSRAWVERRFPSLVGHAKQCCIEIAVRASRGETGPAADQVAPLPDSWRCEECKETFARCTCKHGDPEHSSNLGPGIGGAPIRVRPTGLIEEQIAPMASRLMIRLGLTSDHLPTIAAALREVDATYLSTYAPREGHPVNLSAAPRATLHAGDPKRPDPRVDYSDSMRPAVLGGECAECLHAPPLHERTCSKVARRPQ